MNFISKIIKQDIKKGIHNKIYTRFPPEPNGYLHIGHAKAICLNFGLAKDYQGKCNLRIDDTNPEKEELEFVESIKNDVKWLGFNWSGKVRYSSDYFDQIYQCAIELLNKGLAYVDELSPKLISEYRGTLMKKGKNSPYRNRSVEENLLLFEKMRAGHFLEGQACLRAKIDMESDYMVMRDPVLYRIKFSVHHQTGRKWCIYPMYDFSHCISDALEGITHSLCTLEFQDNRRLYNWILKNITISVKRFPRQYEYSRLNLEYAVMSKRKLTLLVEKNIVEGWNDPRMLTIIGLRRRGYTATAICEFCRRIGITKQDNFIEMNFLESCIRKELNRNAFRAMAVLDPLKIIIENLSINHFENLIVKNHPNNLEMGVRKVPFTRELWIDRSDFREEYTKDFKRLVLGCEVRLRYACVVRAVRVKKNERGEITCIYCISDPSTFSRNPEDGRKIKGVIHWVSVKRGLSAEFRLYDRLFNVRKPSTEKDFLSTINPNSLKVKHGFVELNLKKSSIGVSYQFEREGYFCIDNVDSQSSRLVFNRIVSLRDTYKKN